MQNENIKFRKIRGRIVPIAQSESVPDQQKPKKLSTEKKKKIAVGLASASVGTATFLAFRKFKPAISPALQNVQQNYAKNNVFAPITFTTKKSGSKKVTVNPMPWSLAFADKGIFTKLRKSKNQKYFAKTYTGSTAKNRKSAQQIQKDLFDNKPFIIKDRFGAMTNPSKIVSSEQLKNPMKFKKAKRSFKNVLFQEKIPKKNEFRVHYFGGEAFGVTHRFLPGKAGEIYQKMFGAGRGAFLPVFSSKKRKDLTKFTEQAFSKMGLKDGRLPKSKNVLMAGIDVIEDQKGNFKIIDINPFPGTLGNPFVFERYQQRLTGKRSLAGGLLVGSTSAAATSSLLNRKKKSNGRQK